MTESRRENLAAGSADTLLRIFLIGSRPPSLGGSTVVFLQLTQELREHENVALTVVDTSGIHAPARWSRIVAVMRVLWSVARGTGDADVVSLHASPRGLMVFGWILLPLCRLYRRPLILRIFGGCIDVALGEMAQYAQWILATIFRADCVLLETHHQIAYFQQRYPSACGRWYSNSRPLREDCVADGAPHAARHFVYIGQVKHTKGLPEIIAASRLLATAGIEVDVYGPLQDGMSSVEFDAADDVHYRGVLEPEKVIDTLRRYDVVLLPTYHDGEGYPGIILEAYSAGVPVIATRWRALPEIVDEEVSGLLIEPRSAPDLANAMRRVADSPELMTKLSEGARLRAKEFDSRVLTERFVAICRAAMRRDWSTVK